MKFTKKLEKALHKLERAIVEEGNSRMLSEFLGLKIYLREIDPVLGCVIAEPPHARPGQGERYH